MVGDKATLSRKRKNSILGSKSKCLKTDSEDLIELKLTWEEAQGLLRPPPNRAPSIVIIEGFEFEEYKVLFPCSDFEHNCPVFSVSFYDWNNQFIW